MTPFTTLRPRCAVRSDRRIKHARRLAAVLMLAANTAVAANCDMRLSGNEMDYGALSRGDLAAGAGAAMLPLGKRQATLTIACRQPTTIALSFNGSPAGPGSYRFADNGNFTVQLSNATFDGQAMQFAQLTESPSGAGAAAPTAWMTPNALLGVVSQGARASGTFFSADVEIDTYIDDAGTRVRDVTVLEGRGVFALETR